MGKIAFLGLVIIIIGGVWLLSPAKQAGVEQEAVLAGTIKGHVLELEIARTPEEHARGLSGRARLAENAGMLFVYEQPTLPGFWMKDMYFALDLIWIDAERRIVAVSSNIAPETYPEVFYPPSPVRYVLEVNAGWVKAHNVSVGDEVETSL